MITREQERAIHAFKVIDEIKNSEVKGIQEDYKILVNGFGAHIMRSGLVASMAFVERDKSKKAVKLFLDHLATARVPFLEDATGSDIAFHIRKLDINQYMIVTRELLRVSLWLKRAVQADLSGASS